MNCYFNDNCNVKASCIQQEIENSFHYVANQKQLTTSSVKVYFILISGLLGYAAFLQTKILNLPHSDDFLMFSIFGIIFTFIVFLSGWILLSYISHITSGVSKAYKHISNMRSLKSNFFSGDVFKEHSIMPLNHREVPVRYSRHLPIIFNITNFAVLLMIFYFLNISLIFFWAFSITTLVLSFFAIYYPTACTNFYKHITVAERIKPGKSEVKMTIAIERLLKYQKKNKPYKILKNTLIFLFILFFVIKIFGILYFQEQKIISKQLGIFEGGLLISIFFVRYWMENSKIRSIPIKNQ